MKQKQSFESNKFYGVIRMRIVLPPELEAIGKEVRPYYDFTQKDNLRVGTPSDIREKAAYFKKESDRLHHEAECLDGLPV